MASLGSALIDGITRFQCSSASRKFLNVDVRHPQRSRSRRFQCSSASRKFLNLEREINVYVETKVSVLFSEPKIPQSPHPPSAPSTKCGFSALQRAENSSIRNRLRRRQRSMCFSALQRAENSSIADRSNALRKRASFSALQRAENSSIAHSRPETGDTRRFQCSSASRKFLNRITAISPASASGVSVLFSEPKIPQSPRLGVRWSPRGLVFQCSSASRKFLNCW